MPRGKGVGRGFDEDDLEDYSGGYGSEEEEAGYASCKPAPKAKSKPAPKPAARPGPQKEKAAPAGAQQKPKPAPKQAAKAASAAGEAWREGGTAEGRLAGELHLAVVGLVDAGKSTLNGRLLFGLGQVSQKAVQAAQKEAQAVGKSSFSWAFLLDERQEERERGMTTDVGLRSLETATQQVVLLDCPGHDDFSPQRLRGISMADAALLLVDHATPLQTAQRVLSLAQMVCKLGMAQLAVVVTKLDTLANAEAAQQAYEHIKSALGPQLGSLGFRAVQWLPTAGGENITQPPQEPLLASWWQGASVLSAIESFEPVPSADATPLRVPLLEAAQEGGTRLRVSGRIESGTLTVGAEVLVAPSRVAATVKGIKNLKGEAVKVGRAGSFAEVSLTGYESELAPSVGSVLCSLSQPVPLVTSFTALLHVYSHPVGLLHSGQQVTLHIATALETAFVSRVDSLVDGGGAVIKRVPRAVRKDQRALVELTADRPLCVELFQHCPALGRVVLLLEGAVLAVGTVVGLLD